MANGLYSARRNRNVRKKMRYKSKDYVLRLKRRTEKKDLLEGAPMGRGIVLQKVGIESKQPNSAIRKCVRKRLEILKPMPGWTDYPVTGHNQLLLMIMGRYIFVEIISTDVEPVTLPTLAVISARSAIGPKVKVVVTCPPVRGVV